MRTVALLFLLISAVGHGDELPPAHAGFAWHQFSQEHVIIQVPKGWTWHEANHDPAYAVTISPKFQRNGGFDTGFTLNGIACRTPEEWKDAYYSALESWTKDADGIKALGKPTFEKAIQTNGMQIFTI